MLKVSNKDIEFLNQIIPNLQTMIEKDDLRGLLIALNNVILEEGFAPPDYLDYNDFGRKAQHVYDRLYDDN